MNIGLENNDEIILINMITEVLSILYEIIF